MKNVLYILLCFVTIILYGQKKPFCEHYEKIKAQKVAFLTNRLDLTVEEAQKFWPLYNEYENKKKELFNSEIEIMDKVKDIDKMTEKDIDYLISEYIKIQQRHIQLLEEYNKKFKTVLPLKKIMMLYVSERMFKKEYLHHKIANP
ncbi:MAG: hypothetical protein N3A01_09150 [Bacteroidales bacterium]|nr:hypothetical protein [Bacteroidales bacterium]